MKISSRRPGPSRFARIVVSAVVITAVGLGAKMGSAGSPVTLGWIDWTSPGSFPNSATPPGGGGAFTYATGANGQIAMPDGSTVYVGFSGEIAQAGSGFGAPSSVWNSLGGSAAFTSSNVPSLPSNGDRIGIVGTGVATQTLSFYSDAGRTTPVNVSNVVMLIYSMGGATTKGAWTFNRDFSILSETVYNPSLGGFARTTPGGGYKLSANEGTGAIQFVGTYDSITWEINVPEYYASWNIGATSASPPAAPTTTDASATTDPSATTVAGGTGPSGSRDLSQSGTGTTFAMMAVVMLVAGGILAGRGRRLRFR